MTVSEPTAGRVLVDADHQVKKHDGWSWQNYELECSYLDILGVGQGLKVSKVTELCGNATSDCAYNLESDFRIEKVGTECSDQEGDPNQGIKDPAGS